MRRMTVLVAWIAGLSAAIAILVLAGHGPLAGPPLRAPTAWPAWARAREPLDAAVAVARTASLLVASHLLLMTVLGLVARGAALPRRLGGPLVRSVLGVALGTGMAVAPMHAAVAGVPPATPVMRLLDDRAPPASPPAPVPAPSEPAAYVVVPGDSFWRIAARHLAATLARTPTDREVADYMHRLIAANADRLVVRSQPDLIHPGQRFVLP